MESRKIGREIGLVLRGWSKSRGAKPTAYMVLSNFSATSFNLSSVANPINIHGEGKEIFGHNPRIMHTGEC